MTKGTPFFLSFFIFFCLAWNAFPDFGLVILGIGGPVGPLGVPPTGLRPKQGTIFWLQIFESEGISL